MDITTIQRTLQATSINPLGTSKGVQMPFQDILNEAMQAEHGQAQGATVAQAMVESDKRRKIENKLETDQILIAQATTDPLQNPVIPTQVQGNAPIFTAKNVNTEGLRTSKLEVTPFQFFMDKSIELFQKISSGEQRSDSLMERYARGEISIEEMSIEKAKIGVALSFAVTLVTQVTQAFNELKNMQI